MYENRTVEDFNYMVRAGELKLDSPVVEIIDRLLVEEEYSFDETTNEYDLEYSKDLLLLGLENGKKVCVFCNSHYRKETREYSIASEVGINGAIEKIQEQVDELKGTISYLEEFREAAFPK